MKTTLIIQARMNSTRLPGKVLFKVEKITLLEILLKRLKLLEEDCQIIVGTTTKPIDKKIVNVCKKNGVEWFRGSERNVLERFCKIIKKKKSDIVIRITSDCPLIDSNLIKKGLKIFLKNSTRIDYLSNTLERTYPRGLDFEIFKSKCLLESLAKTTNLDDLEHVTPFIYKNPKQFIIKQLKDKEDNSKLRLTVDIQEDFDLINKILQYFKKTKSLYTFDYKDILKLLKKNPDWIKINTHIKQKEVFFEKVQ